MRANFSAQLHTHDGFTFLKVYDNANEAGTMSITNDADAVVQDCIRRFGNVPIYYRDTDGRWDELEHNGEEFTTFAPIPEHVQRRLRLD